VVPFSRDTINFHTRQRRSEGQEATAKQSPYFLRPGSQQLSVLFPDDFSFRLASQIAPFIDVHDDDMLQAFYYRIRSYRKHIQKTADDKFWIVTEFLPPVPWAGSDNTISAAAGHHIREGRWFWDAPEFVEDYIRFWYMGTHDGTPQPHLSQYTNWIYDATWQYALLWGLDSTRSLLEDTLEKSAEAFRTTYVDKYLTNSSRNDPLWNTSSRICWTQDDGYDAMEVSVSGGGCRPTIASALFGEASALVSVSKFLSRPDLAQEFEKWATFSQNVILEQHWNPSIKSFAVIPPPKPSDYSSRKQRRPNRNRGKPECRIEEVRMPNQPVNVRELLAYMPWYFSSLMDPDHPEAATYARQFQWLLQAAGDDGFSAPWGLRTVQRSSPCYNYSWQHGDCWNGPSWPYETSRVITALANLLIEHKSATIDASGVSPRLLKHLLVQYARQHLQTEAINDTAYPAHSGHIFENLHPDLGYWNNRAIMYWNNDTNKDMGDDYNHSTFLDLIFTAWLGIRMPNYEKGEPWLKISPLAAIARQPFAADRIPYRGRVLSVVYDPLGDKYPKVSVRGLAILIDGQLVAKRSDLGPLTVDQEPPEKQREYSRSAAS
jgi:hypothetical protein